MCVPTFYKENLFYGKYRENIKLSLFCRAKDIRGAGAYFEQFLPCLG